MSTFVADTLNARFNPAPHAHQGNQWSSSGRRHCHRNHPALLADCPSYESRAISESSARTMAVALARSEGIFAGTSSALNITGALEQALELGKGHTVVTVATDTGLKYLSGDLFNN